MKNNRNRYGWCKYLETKAVKKICNHSLEEENTDLKLKKKTPKFL